MLGRANLIALLTEVEAIAGRLSKQTIERFLTNASHPVHDQAAVEFLNRWEANTQPSQQPLNALYRSALWYSILPPDIQKHICNAIHFSAKGLDLHTAPYVDSDSLAYALAGIIPHTPIKELNVSQRHFSQEGLRVIVALALEKLKIKNHGPAIADSKIDVESMRVLASNPHLKAVDLSGNNLRENAVAELVKSRSLLRVNISFNPIQFSGIALFGQMNLLSLNVRNTATYYDELKASYAMQMLAKNTRLQELNLSCLGLKDGDIASLVNLKELILFDIHSNRLTEVSELLTIKTLQYLNVYHNCLAQNLSPLAKERGIKVDEENFPSHDSNVKSTKKLLRQWSLLRAPAELTPHRTFCVVTNK